MFSLIKSFLVILIIFTSNATIASGAKYIFEGDLKQGGLVTANLPKGVKAYLNGKPAVQFGATLLMGFGRDEQKPHSLVLKLPNGKQLIQKFDVEQREYKVQKINNLPKKMVTPAKDVYERIAEDNRKVKEVRNQVIANCDIKESWIKPAEGIITGVYGTKRILNGKPKQPHYGLDIAAPTGTKVIAPRAGKVTLVHEDMYYTGKTLIINHGCGLTSTFIHLSKIDVKEGDFISQGQKIAEIGATGRVTGAHLDWRVNLLNTRLDPALLLD